MVAGASFTKLMLIIIITQVGVWLKMSLAIAQLIVKLPSVILVACFIPEVIPYFSGWVGGWVGGGWLFGWLGKLRI